MTATANNQSREYGDNHNANNVSYSGFKLGQNSSVIETAANVASTAGNTANVGSYADDLVASGAVDTQGNYTFSYMDGDLTITKANLNISVDPASADKNEGDASPTFNLSFGPFKLTDSQSDLDSLPSITTTALTNSPVGSYPVTLVGGLDNNYNYVFTDGVLNILNSENSIIPDAVQRELAIQPQRTQEQQRLSEITLRNPQSSQSGLSFVIVDLDEDNNDASNNKDTPEGSTSSSRTGNSNDLRIKIDKKLADQFWITGL